VLNAMKVFMLEHGQQDAPNTEQDVFRDAGVQAGLRALLGSMGEAQTPPEVARALTAAAKESGEEALLEAASRGFLSAGVPFFQFYTDLLALYEAVSFGDAQFARVLLAPLAMSYPEDYRRLVWAEQPGSLRSIRISVADVPLETSMDAFYIPLETNRDVLLGQARAITGHAAVQAATSPFLFDLAVHHLAGLFFTTDATERTSVRVQLIVVVLSAGQDNVLRSIVQHDLATRGTVSGDERKRRVQLMGELAGPRAVQRLASAGL
jgi:hypothetical protein